MFDSSLPFSVNHSLSGKKTWKTAEHEPESRLWFSWGWCCYARLSKHEEQQAIACQQWSPSSHKALHFQVVPCSWAGVRFHPEQTTVRFSQRRLWLTSSGISGQSFGTRSAHWTLLFSPALNWRCKDSENFCFSHTENRLFSPVPAPAGLFPDTRRPSPLVSLPSWCGPVVQRQRRTKTRLKNQIKVTIHTAKTEI